MFGHKRVPSREGGVEIVVEELGAAMAEKGHQVTCYNRGGHHVSGLEFDHEVKGTYRGIRLKKALTIDKKGLAAVTSSFFASIKSAFSRAQVVHVHAEGPAFMCWLPRLFGKRVIVTVHGLDWAREKWKHGFGAKYIRMGEKMAVRFAHEIIVLSKSVQDYFEKTYGRKTVFIPNGVTKPQRREAQQITERFGLRENEYILFLGRLVPEKGVHYLIEAYKALHTDKKLVIAGGGSEAGDYEQNLKDLAAGNENILFTGFVQGTVLEELYSNAYVYVLPSDLEGMPLSLLEAMSYGNCCVVSDIPECTEVVEDKGVVCARGDISSFTQQLQLLCHEPDRVNDYKKHAAAFICGKYSWDAVVEQTLAQYGKEK